MACGGFTALSTIKAINNLLPPSLGHITTCRRQHVREYCYIQPVEQEIINFIEAMLWEETASIQAYTNQRVIRIKQSAAYLIKSTGNILQL